MNLTDLTLTEALTGLRTRQFSSVDLTQAYLDRIHAIDPQLHAYLLVTDKQALQMARQADERRAAGNDAPLLGIPLAIKDVLCTEGVPTTAGSLILNGFKPPYSATAVQKLWNAGAVLLGK